MKIIFYREHKIDVNEADGFSYVGMDESPNRQMKEVPLGDSRMDFIVTNGTRSIFRAFTDFGYSFARTEDDVVELAKYMIDQNVS